MGPADSSHRVSSHHTSSHCTAKRGLNGQHAQGKGPSKVIWSPLPHRPCRAILLHETHEAPPELVCTHLSSSHYAAPNCQGPGAGRQQGPEQRSEAHHPRARGHGGPPQRSAQWLFWDDNHLPAGPSLAPAAQPWVLGSRPRVPGPWTGLPLAVGHQVCSLTDRTARCLGPSHVESIKVFQDIPVGASVTWPGKWRWDTPPWRGRGRGSG